MGLPDGIRRGGARRRRRRRGSARPRDARPTRAASLSPHGRGHQEEANFAPSWCLGRGARAAGRPTGAAAEAGEGGEGPPRQGARAEPGPCLLPGADVRAASAGPAIAPTCATTTRGRDGARADVAREGPARGTAEEDRATGHGQGRACATGSVAGWGSSIDLRRAVGAPDPLSMRIHTVVVSVPQISFRVPAFDPSYTTGPRPPDLPGARLPPARRVEPTAPAPVLLGAARSSPSRASDLTTPAASGT